MPTFPTYHGPPLPEVLNPLNPRHYWLLFTWIYFQPSRLKHYLHRAGPDLYRKEGWNALRQTLRLPAYRNLYLMSIILAALSFAGLAWVALVVQQMLVNWFSVVVFVLLSSVLGVAGGVASGVVLVVGDVVGNGIGAMSSGLAFLALGMAVAIFVVVGVVVGGQSVFVAFDVVGRLAFVVAFVTFAVAVGLAFSMRIGAGFGCTFGVALGTTIGLILGMAGSMAFGLRVSVVYGSLFGIAGFVAVGIGGSRLIFYIFEWPFAWFSSRSVHDSFDQLERHPAVWDELVVWPLPGVKSLLHACLAADVERGLTFTARIVANPFFQRWAAQRALFDFIMYQADPLVALYRLGDYILDES